MKQLALIVTCLSLLAGVVTFTTPNGHLGSSDRTSSESRLTTLDDIARDGISPIADGESAAIAGAGWRSEFWCGVAAGAGFVLTASGVGAAVGVPVAAAGIACVLL